MKRIYALKSKPTTTMLTIDCLLQDEKQEIHIGNSLCFSPWGDYKSPGLCFSDGRLWCSCADAVLKIEPDALVIQAIFLKHPTENLGRVEPTPGGIKIYTDGGDVVYMNILGEFHKLGRVADLPDTEKEKTRTEFAKRLSTTGGVIAVVPHPVDFPEYY